jgi:hypothetical protein
MRRVIRLTVASLAAALSTAACGSSGSPTTSASGAVGGVQIGAPNAAGGSATNVKLTSGTVVVDRSTVASNLTGVSPGGTYTFSSASGALGALAPGKVMLLQGTDAALVTAVTHSGGHLVVQTSPVTIPEVIQSGNFSLNGPIDWRNAVPLGVDDGNSSGAATPSPSAAAPAASVSLGAAPVRLLGSTSTGLFVQGPIKGGLWSYRVGIFGNTSGINFQGTLCLRLTFKGSTCSNASGGVTGSVTFTGYLDFGDANYQMLVNNGSVAQGGFSVKSMDGHFHLQYEFSEGTSANGNVNLPAFRIPFAWEKAIPLGDIPFYVKVRAAFIVDLGLSSKNSVLQGGVDYSLTGQGGVQQAGSGSSAAPGTTGAVTGNIVGPSLTSISLAAAATVVAAQVKIGPGLGIKEVNAVYYFDVVTTVGQVTGSAVAGMLCSDYTVNISIGGGYEVSIGDSKIYQIVVSQPRTILYQHPPIKYTGPGCPAT